MQTDTYPTCKYPLIIRLFFVLFELYFYGCVVHCFGQCFHMQKACFLPFKVISRPYQIFIRHSDDFGQTANSFGKTIHKVSKCASDSLDFRQCQLSGKWKSVHFFLCLLFILLRFSICIHLPVVFVRLCLFRVVTVFCCTKPKRINKQTKTYIDSNHKHKLQSE